jgi:7,8-dihydropterin-6-yl-methyl-4-(beta-D-ribofuranosyl)aminobenzene 5'-phosphate synthase
MIKLSVLVENTSSDRRLEGEHGLSILIETEQETILFDMGASELFMTNARLMGRDLANIDLAVLSHGHYDHGGGLASLLAAVEKVPVYVNRQAFRQYYSDRPQGKKYIGLDQQLKDNGRIVFIDGQYAINERLSLFTSISNNWPVPAGNRSLLEKLDDGSFINDRFQHEHNLVIKDGDRYCLIAGCAHNGILNIIDSFAKIYGCYPHYVVSGLHLYNRNTDESEPDEIIAEIADYLISKKIVCFTGHCTGLKPYNKLRELMGARIGYIATGTVLEL